MKKNSIQQGFTLVEILVTIGILSIHMVGILAIIDPVSGVQKANDAKRKSDLAQVQRLLELYYNDNQQYPAALPFGSSWGTYSNKLPDDPSNNKNYDYKSVGQGQTYYMYASLDRGGKDKQACKSNGNACNNANGLNCGGVCNYGVSSSNATP